MKFYAIFIFLFMLFSLSASQEENKIITQKILFLEQEQKALKKELLDLKKEQKKYLSRNASFLEISCHFSPKTQYGANLELLNSNNSSDQYSFVDYTMDTTIKSLYDQSFSNLQRLSFCFSMRIKGIMGEVGKYLQITETPIKIGRAMNDVEHSHSVNRLLFWARELWMKYHFYQSEASKSFFQIGLFPYHLGNGFSLGNAHIMGQAIPGLYNKYSIDQFRPGLLLSTEPLKDILSCQFYLGFIKTRDNNFNATTSFTNAQSLEQTNKPYRGPWKKNLVFTTQAFFEPFKQEKNKPDITFNPYLLIEHNNDCNVEFSNDANDLLYTVGLAYKYENKAINCNLEFAHNFGQQKVKNWDRNLVLDSGSTFQNHLFYVPSGTTGVTFSDSDFTTNGVTDPDDFEFSTLFITPGNTANNYANGEKFAVASTGGNYNFFKNSYSRFRKSYTNKFTGWMVYGDLQYKYNNWTNALAAGCATGQNSPNDSEEKIMLTRLTSGITYKDFDKNYKGFIGIQEMFEGKTIQTHFMFEAQKMQQRLCSSAKLTQPMFSNLIFFGLHSDYVIEKKYGNFQIQTNLINFFQYTKTEKGYNYHLTDSLNVAYTAAHKTDSEKLLGYHLGTEINVSIKGHLSQDTLIFGTCAFFIPGNYYTNALGKYVPISTQVKLAGTDFTGIEDNENKYGIKLGNDSCLLFSLGIKGTFNLNNFAPTKISKKKLS